MEAQSYSDYCRLSNQIEKVSSNGEKLKIAFLRSFTIEPLLPVVRTKIAQMDYLPEFYIGEYDNIAQEVFNKESGLYKFSADFIVMFQWLEQIAPNLSNRFLSLTGEDDVNDEIERVSQQMSDYISAIRAQTNTTIVLNNFPVLENSTLGILDSQSSQFYYGAFKKLNARLIDIKEQFPGVYILDLERMFSVNGIESSYDKRSWYMAQAPLGKNILVSLGDTLSLYFKSLTGKVKKCLVLDCDNTIWGGIVGEDGLSGIKLGNNFPGAGYLDFQKEILNLHDRGVMITLCSKNNEDDVLEVLNNHDSCLIKKEHLSSYKINWNDKATNIEGLAQELNIGLDSFVFVDDSEFECNLVRERLPMVEVIQAPKQSFKLPGLISKTGLFDSLTYSREDRKKNSMYRSDKIRKKILSESNGIEDYLRKLGLKAELGTPAKDEISRVSQLTQKTNQFNLTTKRYTEADIHQFIDSDEYEIFRLKLSDNTSELGIIAAVIVSLDGDDADIDSFLMSCRALGRGVEKTILSYLLSYLKDKNIKTINGQYRKTKKNEQVRNFYSDHGFDCILDTDDEKNFKIYLGSTNGLLAQPDWIDLSLI